VEIESCGAPTLVIKENLIFCSPLEEPSRLLMSYSVVQCNFTFIFLSDAISKKVCNYVGNIEERVVNDANHHE
jgi:hypothetical protein